jgi:hypothetical protein
MMTVPATIDRQHTHLGAVIVWAEKLRAKLQPLLDANGHRVHFRPASGGVTMVGLLHHRPQRGIGGLRDLDQLVADFEVLFAKNCADIPQGRGTDEKELQSYLIREARRNGRHIEPLNAAFRGAGSPVDLVFITDEIPLPGDGEKTVCDILALLRTWRAAANYEKKSSTVSGIKCSCSFS